MRIRDKLIKCTRETFGYCITIFLLFIIFSSGCSNMMGNDLPGGNGDPLDLESPVIIEFSLTGKSHTSIPEIPVAVDATDDTGIAAWLITETAVNPVLNDPGWQREKPESYTLQNVEEGNHQLYAWAMDSAGNISDAADFVTVNLAEPSEFLSGLVLSREGIDPGFSPGITSYLVNVPLTAESLTFTPEASDPDGMISINGTACGSGEVSDPVELNFGVNNVEIKVTSSTGTEQSYSFDVARGIQEAYIKASNTGSGDQLSDNSLALHGNTLAVGARGEDSSTPNSGSVYVFVRNDGVWTQQAFIKASNPGEYDQFGISVALHGDTLAVGANGEDSSASGINGDQSNNISDSSGAVYIFTRSGTTWSQEAYIKASNPDMYDGFGVNVSLHEDTLAVAACGEDSSAAGVNGNQLSNSTEFSGAVYIFTRSGTTWSQEAYIKASSPGAVDYFGESITLHGDTLAVGAPREDSSAAGINGDEENNDAESSGAVYVFARSGGSWTQEAYVKASNTTERDGFGLSVSLFGDSLAVGSPSEDSAATGVGGDQLNSDSLHSGAVYLFTRSGSTWSQEAYIKASNNESGDGFGGEVSLYENALAVGARGEDSAATGINGDQYINGASYSGAVYLFRRSGSDWWQEVYFKASNTGASDYFGSRISLYGDILAVGAYGEDSSAAGINGNQSDEGASLSGAVYVFY